MNVEENKAIEWLKTHIIPCYGHKGRIEFMLNDVILNLIEKQQKEIVDLHLKVEMKSIAIIRKDPITKELFAECYMRKDEIENNYISKDKIKEIIKLTQNKEIVKLPNNETICVSDCYELLNYLQELLKEGENK